MHVNKLRDVNGLKLHNLVLKTEGQPNVNKTVYISNPLESKLPQAYLSFDEFKRTLTERVQKQKEEVREENSKAKRVQIKIYKRKTTSKSRLPRTIYFYKQENMRSDADAKSNEKSVAQTKSVTKTTRNINIHHIVPGTFSKLFRRTTSIIVKLVALKNDTNNHRITTADNENKTSKTPVTIPELKEETETAKDSKQTETESLVPSKNETIEVTDVNVTETLYVETTTTTAPVETMTTETVNDEPMTTTISTRATLGVS